MVRRKTGKNPQSHTNQNSFSLDDGRYVSIYCRGTIAAAHEKYRVGSLRADIRDGELFWSVVESGYAEAGADGLTPIKPRITQWLDGNDYLHRAASGNPLREGESDTSVFYKESFRTSWLFSCETCGEHHKVPRPREIYPVLTAIFTKYGESGVLEISLRELIGVS